MHDINYDFYNFICRYKRLCIIPAGKHIQSLTIQEDYLGKTHVYNDTTEPNLTNDFIWYGGEVCWSQWGTVTISVVIADGPRSIAALQSLKAQYVDSEGTMQEIDIPIEPMETTYNVGIQDPNITGKNTSYRSSVILNIISE